MSKETKYTPIYSIFYVLVGWTQKANTASEITDCTFISIKEMQMPVPKLLFQIWLRILDNSKCKLIYSLPHPSLHHPNNTNPNSSHWVQCFTFSKL